MVGVELIAGPGPEGVPVPGDAVCALLADPAPNVERLSSTSLHDGCLLAEPVRDVAVHAAGNESRLAYPRAIPRRRAQPCAARVAEDAAVGAREQLEVRHTVRNLVQMRQAG